MPNLSVLRHWETRVGSARVCQVAVRLDAEQLAPLGEPQAGRQVAARVVIAEHHEVVRAVAGVEVRVRGAHVLQRAPHQLRGRLRSRRDPGCASAVQLLSTYQCAARQESICMGPLLALPP